MENKAGKFLATMKSTSDHTKAPTGSFEAVLSIPTVDRDGEVLDAGCFNPLPDHITIDIDHAMSVEKTVGSGRPFYDGPVLKFEGTYASTPLAQMVRSLVDEGHIRTMSVAYMGSQYEVDEKDGRPHLRSAELLNAGIVGIPSNRDALITYSKSLQADVAEVVEKAGARHSTGDLAELQTIHDSLVKLGVVCDSKSHDADDNKTSTETNPENTAAEAADVKSAADVAVESPAAVEVALAKAALIAAQADLALL